MTRRVPPPGLRFGLPPGWARRERFVALFTAFGDGADLVDLWRDWSDRVASGSRLDLIALAGPLPCSAAALRLAHAGTPRAAVADALACRWPPAAPGLHRMRFGPVQLLLHVGERLRGLREIAASADAIVVDEATAAAEDPVRLAKSLARLAAPGARLHSRQTSPSFGAALRSAGFCVTPADAPGASAIVATFDPPFALRRRSPAAAGESAPHERRAVVVGAGLAGCAAAWALAEQGWSCRLVDRREGVAQEASSNPAGLFHGTVHADDGVHARFNRAAALQAAVEVRTAIAEDGVAGAVDGLLRLNPGETVAAMSALAERQRLPSDYVRAVGAADATSLAGWPIAAPAWFFACGGWVDPGALARSFLRRAGPTASLSTGTAIAALQREGDAWVLLDAAGRVVDRCATVVLANAGDALRLAGEPIAELQKMRGQVSWVDATGEAAGWPSPRLPIAGSGYLLPAGRGRLLFGATASTGDVDPALRDADQRFNVERLRRLCAQPLPAEIEAALARLNGRVGWRCVAPDRLPLIGAVPDAAEKPGAGRPVEAWPRLAGLYLFTALASRGITWAALGAQLLAAIVAGAPLPIERPLVRAVDPARFVQRHQRRVCGHAPGHAGFG